MATALPQVVTAGMTEFCEEVTARMSSGWVTRFLRDLDAYVLHAIRYAGMSTADDPPALDEFLVLRREEGAAQLAVGSEVAFVEESGDEGPQASTVRVLSKHHYITP